MLQSSETMSPCLAHMRSLPVDRGICVFDSALPTREKRQKKTKAKTLLQQKLAREAAEELRRKQILEQSAVASSGCRVLFSSIRLKQ